MLDMGEKSCSCIFSSLGMWVLIVNTLKYSKARTELQHRVKGRKQKNIKSKNNFKPSQPRSLWRLVIRLVITLEGIVGAGHHTVPCRGPPSWVESQVSGRSEKNRINFTHFNYLSWKAFSKQEVSNLLIFFLTLGRGFAWGGWEIFSIECVMMALLSGTIKLLLDFLSRFLTEKVLRNNSGFVSDGVPGVRLCEDWLLLSRRGFQEFGKTLLITLLFSSSDTSMPLLRIYSSLCQPIFLYSR